MNRKLLNLIHTRRGLALISVLAMVTLATVIVLALFSMSDGEFKASKVYAGGNMARQFGDSAVNTVISQIRSATYDDTNPKTPQIWASQPGEIRVYDGSGTFTKGFKLYSDSQMVVTGGGIAGETSMATDVPAFDWNLHPDQYADLNEPVVRVDGTQTRMYFPIVDPRAAMDDPATADVEAVEGFSYTKASAVTGATTNITGVVTPTEAGGQPNNLRLPMPVEWMYVLKDGSLGTVDAKGDWVAGAGTVVPSDTNPIIGRVAFWTDDEGSKVNINTASEPGYWAVPSYYHERDKSWVDAPPALNEYQRFPGHPATVALSTILYPSADPTKPRILDSFGKTGSELSQVLDIKDRIYKIMPKLNGGGSKDGTLVFDDDTLIGKDSLSSTISIVESKRERLYASLDEMIFSEQVQPSGASKLRTENDFTISGVPLLTPASLDKKRFFMTAQSRAPEFNMFGLPRVAMWPIPDKTLGDKYRTGFDTMLATTATLSNSTSSSNTYYFSRLDPASPYVDVGADAGGRQGLQRNAKLLKYLDSMMDMVMPGASTGQTFRKKFNGTDGYNDSRQILVEIFDYIRCTNLYDSFLAPEFKADDSDSPMNYRTGTSATDPHSLEQVSVHKTAPKSNSGQFYTYTQPRFKVYKTDWRGQEATSGKDIPNEYVAAGSYPGHGQVIPTIWVGPDGKKYRGFGRFPTISEVSLHFICTADGKPDAGSFVSNGVKSGGKTAERIDPNPINQRIGVSVPIRSKDSTAYWYSNFPPFPSKDTFTQKWGCTFTPRDQNHALNHPAADPMNWNATLERDTPLAENEKRVQLSILIELFVPSVGWTKYSPKWSVVLDADFLSGIKVKDSKGNLTSVFSATEDRILKSNQEFSGGTSGLGDNYGIYPIGSTASPRACTAGRHCIGTGNLPKDPSYDDNATSSEEAGLYNYPFISNPVTISRPNSDTDLGDLTFQVTRPLVIRIHGDHWAKNKEQAVQKINIDFPSGETVCPAPQLVVYATEKRQWESGGNLFTHDAVQASHWWAFHRGGALDRWTGQYVSATGVNAAAVQEKGSGNLLPGRFTDPGGNSNPPFDGGRVPANGIIYGYDPTNTGVKHTKDTYTKAGALKTMGTYEHYGSDTIRSMIPKYGDYRIIAAKQEVPAEMWATHPLWDSRDSFFAHNLCSYFSNTETGFHLGGSTSDTANNLRRLVKGQDYGSDNAYVPDMPHSDEAMRVANRYGDFDTGPGNCRDGGYINKPDEGNLSCINLYLSGSVRRLRNAYFHDSYLQLPSREAFFTPNRMISSPGMLGSLSAGVYAGGRDKSSYGEGGIHGDPWRTLLFRADAMTGQEAAANRAHPGAGFGNGAIAPADHYFMDLFWMPIIEPYAISDNWASTGKINMNFQIQPFSYIKRATALYAAMKGELITAIPKEDGKMSGSTSYKQFKSTSTWPEQFFSDKDKKYWHRYIDLATTTNLMAARMNLEAGVANSSRGLFRTASQICEVHLVPQIISGAKFNPASGINASNVTSQMGKFWKDNAITGENVRERPYANLYQKLTTRSNVFRIHYRAQSLKKARSLAPTEVRTIDSTGTGSTDTVLAEYRASALIERYLNMSTTMPDYGASTTPMTLGPMDQFYRYRVLETKQFAP